MRPEQSKPTTVAIVVGAVRPADRSGRPYAGAAAPRVAVVADSSVLAAAFCGLALGRRSTPDPLGTAGAGSPPGWIPGLDPPLLPVLLCRYSQAMPFALLSIAFR